ncbi:MAG: thioredoxin family protein [Fimbriimonadaceae bacterium]|nr:thioredoxin family protein [Fimbriimonadaceae bacterium]QYK55344.1 MAG: thioredoxin family protein [Fimbriimonadaceae bacterium]
MKRAIMFAALMSVAVAARAIDVSPKLQAAIEAMAKAETLKMTVTVSKLGGSSEQVTVALAKPNMARVETASTLTVADGTNVTTYDKNAKTFYKQPQDAAKLGELFDSVALMPWKAFFDGAAFKNVYASRDMGNKNRGGKSYDVVTVQVDKDAQAMVTLYIDPSDRLPRQGEVVVKTKTASDQSVWNVSGLATEAASDLFAFKAPAGAKELDFAAMTEGKWFTNFEEARKVSEQTGKMMMVDFYATWCGPCKMMAAEAFTAAEFKKKAKDFILVKLDAEAGPNVALAQKYNVEAYPTVKFIDAKGRLVYEYVGYAGLSQVLADMDKALKAAN